MNGSTDHERDDLVGDLATVTDEEWRDAHERLTADLLDATGSPEECETLGDQLAYEWAPGRTPDLDPHERDIAPAPGQWIGRAPDGDTR